MFHEAKASISPPKGKPKIESNWPSGWWDFYPLAEGLQRPVEWSRSCTIYTAHPTQPIVVARLFSSSEQFILPSPSPVVSSPASYEPPSIISVAPSDDWLFAYFPGSEVDGVGCLWGRGSPLDDWRVRECWSISRAAGIVIASWAGTEREWTLNPAGSAIRLPPTGPATPVSSPTLLLVTRSHRLQVYYLRSYVTSLKVMSCSLIQPGTTSESNPNPVEETINGPLGVRVCTMATVGLGYNESAMIIAMRSQILPTTNVSSLGSSNSLGEESTIDLCEVLLTFDGIILGLTANPLPPLQHSLTHLSNMSLIPVNALETIRSPLQRKDVLPAREEERKCFYLVASFIDFEDFTSIPKSELVVHSITRRFLGSTTKKQTWHCKYETARSFEAGVISFFVPCRILSNSSGIYIGVREVTVTASEQKKTKDVVVGNVTLLNLPELVELQEWEKSPIVSSFDRIGSYLPTNAAVSPNGRLLCTVSSSIWASPSSIHALPRRRSTGTSGNSTPSAIVAALRARRTTADITHALSLPATSLDEVVDVLYNVLALFETQHNGLPKNWTWEALGVAVEIYQARSHNTAREHEQEHMVARAEAGQDMCSLAACNMAFGDCQEGEAYDLEAVWQLVGLSGWIMRFAAKLLGECLLCGDVGVPNPVKVEEGATLQPASNTSGTSPGFPRLDSPILVHLIHPYPLLNLVGALHHVQRFRNYLWSLSARAENAHLARTVLIDIVDGSGVDLAMLLSALNQIAPDVNALHGGADTRRSLAACQPVPLLSAALREIIAKLTVPGLVNKPRVLIEASDLVDEFTRFSLSDNGSKESDRDVISKGLLLKHGPRVSCQRCGGVSAAMDVDALASVSIYWRTWEKVWRARCLCGGSWAIRGL